jgi:hypothetical protein
LLNIKQIIQEVESDENKRRKAEHAKRHDVYNDHQRPHVLAALLNEFSTRTVQEMRTCTSINLSRRMVDEMASLYKRPPVRDIEIESQAGAETEAQAELKTGLLALYDDFRVNVALKRANQKYKLHDQACIQVIPKDGKICLRVLAPHQYDVVPDPNDPEKAIAYIISTYDRSNLDNITQRGSDIQGQDTGSKNEVASSGMDKDIADQNDYRATLKKYIVWTMEEILVVNAQGEILSRDPNPILALPFIDIAQNKDFEYWIRRGSGVVEFAIDYSVALSDTVNTNRLQSYAQAVITAEKVPESVTVGPNQILFLPLDPSRPEAKPSFEFVSPQPDMKSSLELLDRLLNYFMTSRGIDPKAISSDGKTATYASGLERLLAMIDRFEASQDDLDLFSCVEYELFELLRAWYQVIRGTPLLDDQYDFGEWPEDAELCVKFAQPQMVQTQTDKEASVVARMENGLMSRVEAIEELRGVSKEEAQKVADEIDREGVRVPPQVQVPNQPA